MRLAVPRPHGENTLYIGTGDRNSLILVANGTPYVELTADGDFKISENGMFMLRSGVAQFGVADPSFGSLNGGMFINPPTGGAGAFVPGGGFLLVTSPADKDAMMRIASFDNNQGIDIISANASGDNFIDTRYTHRTDRDQYTGTRLFFRMNTGGNVLTGPDGALAYELVTLAAGGTESGGGMVGIGVGGYAPQAGLHLTPAVYGKSGMALGAYFVQTLTAKADSDKLIALRIDPTFADGGKATVVHRGLVLGNYAALTKPVGFTEGMLAQIANTSGDAGLQLSAFNLNQGGDFWHRNSDAETFIDNRYDNAAAGITVRARTLGTPVTVARFLSTGLTVSVPVDATALKISGTAGIDTTVTTGSLVGKTMTFTKGLLTGFV